MALSRNKRIIVQIWIIFLIGTLFSISATMSKVSVKTNKSNIILWDCFFIFTFIILTCILIRGVKIGDIARINLNKIVYDNKWLILLVLFTTIPRICQMNVFPRWDTDAYYGALSNACNKFDFTINTYMQAFRLCGHTSLGYSLFVAIGYFIVPNSLIGVNIVNYILTEICIVFLYKIIRRCLKTVDDMDIFLATLLVVSEPMFLGTFYNINIDYPLIIFFVFIVYFSITNRNVLTFFFSVVLVQTKEVGIVILAGYFIGYVLLTFICEKKINRKTIENILFNPILVSVYFGCLMMVYYKIWVNLTPNVGTWGENSSGVSEVSKINYFSFNISYIFLKIKTIVCANFCWLVFFVILVCFINLIMKKKKILGYIKKNKEVLSMFVGGAFLVCFNCLYITYNNPRYNMLISVEIVLFMVIILYKLVSNKKCCRAVIVVILLLFMFQSYTTIDPVMYKIFENRNTSDNVKIVHTGWDNYVSLIADISIYNNQNSYIDKCFDNILEKEKYSSDKDIIVGGVYDNNREYEGVRACFFKGKTIPVYWNTKKKKRVFYENNNNESLNIVYQQELEYKRQNNQLKNEAILVILKEFSDNEEQILNRLNQYYNISNRKASGIFGQGTIYYYNLKLKN